MDIRLLHNPLDAEVGFIDLGLEKSDLATGRELETAIILSLFTNRRAEPDDPLPEGFTDRQGWWGDPFSEKDSDRIGSRLWLLAQEKQTTDTLNRAREYCQEALEWFVTDGIAKRVNLQVEWVRMHVLGIWVELAHPDGTTSRFEFLWDQIRQQKSRPNDDPILPTPPPAITDEDGNVLMTEDGILLVI